MATPKLNREFSELLFKQLGNLIKNIHNFSRDESFGVINFLFVISIEWNLQDVINVQVKSNFRKLKLDQKIIFSECLVKYCQERLLHTPKNKRISMWLEKIKPFLKIIWPHSKGIESKQISKSLACICLLSGPKHFKESFQYLKPWIHSVNSYDDLLDIVTDKSNHLLNKSNAQALYELFELLTNELTFTYGRDDLYKQLFKLDSSIQIKNSNRR